MYYWVNLEKCWEDFKQIAATTSTTEVVDAESWENRPIRLTQCCTQFKSHGDTILCVLYLHYNVAFTFKSYGNS